MLRYWFRWLIERLRGSKSTMTAITDEVGVMSVADMNARCASIHWQDSFYDVGSAIFESVFDARTTAYEGRHRAQGERGQLTLATK